MERIQKLEQTLYEVRAMLVHIRASVSFYCPDYVLKEIDEMKGKIAEVLKDE